MPEPLLSYQLGFSLCQLISYCHTPVPGRQIASPRASSPGGVSMRLVLANAAEDCGRLGTNLVLIPRPEGILSLGFNRSEIC